MAAKFWAWALRWRVATWAWLIYMAAGCAFMVAGWETGYWFMVGAAGGVLTPHAHRRMDGSDWTEEDADVH